MAPGAIVRASAPAAGASIGPAVREASVTALVALVLLAPLLGMRTSSGPTGPTLTFHFGWVAIAVAVVFAGRLLLTLARRAPAAAPAPPPSPALAAAGRAGPARRPQRDDPGRLGPDLRLRPAVHALL
jgi:hypothetical protein